MTAAAAGRNGSSSSHDLGTGPTQKKTQDVTKAHVEEAKADLERTLRSPEAVRRLRRAARKCVSDVEDDTRRIESGAYRLPEKEKS